MAYSKYPENRSYTIGSLIVYATVGVVTADGATLPLGKKVVATLAALAERTGEVVPKATLIASTWGEAPIDDSSLWQNVHVLRAILASHAPHARIETVKGRGYRLTFAVPTIVRAPARPRAFAWQWTVAAMVLTAITVSGIVRATVPTPHPLHRIVLIQESGNGPLPPLPPFPN